MNPTFLSTIVIIVGPLQLLARYLLYYIVAHAIVRLKICVFAIVLQEYS
ncbi:MAG: hypothetical protein K0S24_1591 [Sphingobacterium sp.]|jgi:hypothetical protein|nr:hypothetical protein [Sphingobacterium sp.]